MCDKINQNNYFLIEYDTTDIYNNIISLQWINMYKRYLKQNVWTVNKDMKMDQINLKKQGNYINTSAKKKYFNLKPKR